MNLQQRLRINLARKNFIESIIENSKQMGREICYLGKVLEKNVPIDDLNILVKQRKGDEIAVEFLEFKLDNGGHMILQFRLRE